MPITTGWDNADKSIIRYTFHDDWTWQQLYIALNESRVLQDSVFHRVDIVLDMTKTTHVPDDSAEAFRQIAYTRHPNTGIRIFVGADEAIHDNFDAFARVYRKVAETYRFVDTFDEAYALIEQEHDQLELECF